MAEAVQRKASTASGSPCMGQGGRGASVEEVMRIFIRKPGFLFARIDQIANALYAAHSAGETLAQAELLLAIAAGRQTDQIGLARACGIDTSTTAIILDNLQGAGLIARVQDDRDRRRSLPVLTMAGGARIPAVESAFAALQRDLLSGFDRAERDRLAGRLGKIGRASEAPAPPLDSAVSPFADAPSFLCRRALQISLAQFTQRVAPLVITLRQFSALVILHLRPGLSQIAFARIFGLDPSTCALVLKKLAARGDLAARRSPEDRRKTLYRTTAQGRRLAAQIQPLADQSEALVLAALDDAEIAELLSLLQAIVRRHSGRLRFPGCLPWDAIVEGGD